MIVPVFDSAQALGRSLAGPLRPDLAAEFAEARVRFSVEVVVSRTA